MMGISAAVAEVWNNSLPQTWKNAASSSSSSDQGVSAHNVDGSAWPLLHPTVGQPGRCDRKLVEGLTQLSSAAMSAGEDWN